MQQQSTHQHNSTEDLLLSEAVEQFLGIGLAVTSPQTVDWYKRRLFLFQKEIKTNNLSQIKQHHLWYWYIKLQDRTRSDLPNAKRISIYTQHGYVRAVRRFFKWLYERGLIEAELTGDLKLPKLPKNGKKGVSEKNVVALLRATSTNNRDYAILRFIESTGCRRAGVADLRLSDLNLDEDEPLRRRVTIREKGSKERVVFLSPESLDALINWLKERQSKSEFVFTNMHDRDCGLSPSGVSQIIERYKEKAGIKGPVSPHQWRHRHGRKLIEAGMPLGLVSQILGHASVVVTNDFYGMFAVNELQRAVDTYYKPPEENKRFT